MNPHEKALNKKMKDYKKGEPIKNRLRSDLSFNKSSGQYGAHFGGDVFHETHPTPAIKSIRRNKIK